MDHRRFLGLLTIIYLGLWFALAINPSHRQDWMLENVLVVIVIVTLAATVILPDNRAIVN